MPLYGFPAKMASWVMTCVRSAQFTVVLNGAGSGFFKPECGLRQGCALSPYLFIIGMDILSRQLSALAQSGVLRGVRLAPSSEPLICCLYADDLLIFGEAMVREATIIMQSLDRFSAVLGQQIGPSKSSIWFNRPTEEVIREAVAWTLQVSLQTRSPKYLGAPIETYAQAYNFLSEKVEAKLQAWKGRLLSPAGRLILVKSVLMSIPVYFMGKVKLPKKVTDGLTGTIRRFF